MRTLEVANVGIFGDGAESIPLGTFPPELDIPQPTESSTPVDYAEAVGESYLFYSERSYRKDNGHYQTPATYMVGSCSYAEPHLCVLDLGSGTGILSAAVCETAGQSGTVKSLHIDAYETDPLLANLTNLVLSFSRSSLARRGKDLTFDVRQSDFVLANAAVLQQQPKLTERSAGVSANAYSLVISNPPYVKIRKDDPRAVAWPSVVHGQPSIYALFMSISAELLS